MRREPRSGSPAALWVLGAVRVIALALASLALSQAAARTRPSPPLPGSGRPWSVGPASAATVKLGVVCSRAGPEAASAESLRNGVELALGDLRKEGTDVQIVWGDGAATPEAGIDALEKLARRDGVAGVVGACGSAVTSAVAKAAERYAIPLLVPVATKDEITRLGFRWVYRLCAPTAEEIEILVDMALALGEPRTLAILSADSDFGISGAKVAKGHAKSKGLKVVFEERYAAGSTDHLASLGRVKAARPDLLLALAQGADAAAVARQSREIDLSPRAFLGAGPGFAEARYTEGKALPDGFFWSKEWTEASSPGARDFGRRYREAFGSPPTPDAAASYAALRILAEEAAKAGGDREAIRRRLEGGSWETALGPVRFAEYHGYTHQNRVRMQVEQVQAGRPVTVWPKDLAAAKPVWPFPGWK